MQRSDLAAESAYDHSSIITAHAHAGPAMGVVHARYHYRAGLRGIFSA